MSPEEKKALLLLRAIIFHYHGLDEDEKQDLYDTAVRLDATDALDWCHRFIEKDIITAFDRARDFLREIMTHIEKGRRLEYLVEIWKANLRKGYVSEMEAMGILTLAKDWDIENELVYAIKSIL